MTTTPELIHRLDTDAAGYFTCVMAVAFDNTTICISSNDPDCLQLPNDAVWRDSHRAHPRF